MKNKIYTALLSCIGAVLEGREKELSLPEEVDRAQLFALAKRHNLVGFLYRVSNYDTHMPKEMRVKIEAVYFAVYAQSVEQQHFKDRLLAWFEEHKIPHMPMKGLVIRELYPDPALRSSCDLDVFYDKTHRVALHKWLCSIGFEEGVHDVHNDSYHSGHVTFEAHYSLSENNPKERKYYANAWERLETDNGIAYRFAPEDFYIYMLLHARKHFYEGNIGVRYLLDVHLFRRANPDMNEAYLANEFKKLDLAAFAATMERLARIWFENEASDDNMDFLGEFIFEGGARVTLGQNALMLATDERGGGRFRYVMRKIFPPYNYMARYSKALQKCPVLLPFYWIGRWFRILFSGRKRKHYFVEKSAMPQEALERVIAVRRIVEGKQP